MPGEGGRRPARPVRTDAYERVGGAVIGTRAPRPVPYDSRRRPS